MPKRRTFSTQEEYELILIFDSREFPERDFKLHYGVAPLLFENRSNFIKHMRWKDSKKPRAGNITGKNLSWQLFKITFQGISR